MPAIFFTKTAYCCAVLAKPSALPPRARLCGGDHLCRAHADNLVRSVWHRNRNEDTDGHRRSEEALSGMQSNGKEACGRHFRPRPRASQGQCTSEKRSLVPGAASGLDPSQASVFPMVTAQF